MQPSDLLFVCRADDELAVAVINHLGSLTLRAGTISGDGKASPKYTVRVLGTEERAPVGSVAVYTGYNEQWPSRHFRMAAHRLYVGRPDWAVTTPFLVAIRPTRQGDMNHAVEEMAKVYFNWLNGDAGVLLPWETKKGPTSSYKSLVEEWLDLVAENIGETELQRILASQHDDAKIRGRGGDVIYRHLNQYEGRVLLTKDDVTADIPGNSVYQELVGFGVPAVTYGTSDIANFFELFEALKLGHVLGMPVVFETYPSAHSVGRYLVDFLNPSLDLLGGKVSSVALGMEGQDKYTAVLTKESLPRFIKAARLEIISEELYSWADKPLWCVYQNAMRRAADMLLEALKIEVPYAFTTTEQICQASGLWDISLAQLAKEVEAEVGHSIVILNVPEGNRVLQLKSSDPLPEGTVAQMHQRGCWLGGAAIYYLIFRLGKFGGVVAMVKDSSAGRVNMLAEKFFTPDSHLYVAPVGLFRLSADKQNEDWSIDPLVLLALIKQWGPEKTAEYARLIWDSMEVPLAKVNTGTKTVAKVTPSTVQVRVTPI